MSALLLLPRWLGIGKIDVIPAVGALITGKAENALPIGYVVHFTSGIIFAYIYWGVLLPVKLPVVWWTFGMAGFIHGIIVMLLVCIAVMEHHPIAHPLRRRRWIGRGCFAMSLASSCDGLGF
jgi:hypothetical protein